MIDIESVKEVFEENLPEAMSIIEADLSVLGTLCFSDQTLPIALIHSGPSSSLKTETINFLFPDESHQELHDILYRVDTFTPASFVTHAANVKADKLEKIDLLPKLKSRVLLTKELSPIFTGKKDDLTKTFSILTSVLDGQGYVSTSGVRGTRGYDEPICFNWIGATKPFANDVHYLLSALGPRLYFFNVSAKPKKLDDLVKYAKKENHTVTRAKCRQAVQDFLVHFFYENPKLSQRSEDIKFNETLLEYLVLFTMAMSRLRAQFSFREGSSEKEHKECQEERFGAPDREGEFRAIQIFKMLARGRALIHGRSEVNTDDLNLIRHIALSSCPEPRRKVFEAVVSLLKDPKSKERAGTSDIVDLIGMSKMTVLHYMKELHFLGLVELCESEIEYFVVFNEPYNKLLVDPTSNLNLDQTGKDVGDWFEAQGKAIRA